MNTPLMDRPPENESAIEHPLDELHLPARAHNALYSHGISTIERLALLSDDDILGLRGLGVGSLSEIRRALASWGAPLPALPQRPAQPAPTPWVLEEGLPDLLLNDPGAIAALDLSSRSRNCLLRAQVLSVAQLAQLSREALLSIRNLGMKSCSELCAALATYANRRSQGEPPPELPVTPPSRRDPWILVEGLPRTLLFDQTPITLLGLSPRSMHCLENASVNTIGNLCTYSRRELGQLHGLGSRVWADIHSCIANYLAVGPALAPRIPTFSAVINQWLDRLDERTKEMICLRYGLGCERLTMQQIAERWGITRARVEQIVNHKAIRHLEKIAGGAPLRCHVQILRDYVAQKGGLVSEAELRQELGACMDLGDANPLLACQVLAIVDDGLDWMESFGALRDETISYDTILAVRQEARRLLTEMDGQAALGRVLLLLRQSRVCIEQGNALSDAALVACLRTDRAFEMADDAISYSRRLPDLVERILVAS